MAGVDRSLSHPLARAPFPRDTTYLPGAPALPFTVRTILNGSYTYDPESEPARNSSTIIHAFNRDRSLSLPFRTRTTL